MNISVDDFISRNESENFPCDSLSLKMSFLCISHSAQSSKLCIQKNIKLRG